MYCTRKVTDDIIWVGGNDRRLSVFEGVYKCPTGVSYNSYLIKDGKNVLIIGSGDTALPGTEGES